MSAVSAPLFVSALLAAPFSAAAAACPDAHTHADAAAAARELSAAVVCPACGRDAA